MYIMKYIYHEPKTMQTTMYTSTTLGGKKTTFERHKRNRFECNNDREMQLTICGGSWTSHWWKSTRKLPEIMGPWL